MDDDASTTAAPHYALGRLQQALETAVVSGDPATPGPRSGQGGALAGRALDGMASGGLAVGSRTPVADAPAWVTLEVVHGGFATGRFLAEQPAGRRRAGAVARTCLPARVRPIGSG